MKSLFSAFDFSKNDDVTKQLEPDETVRISTSLFKFNKKAKKNKKETSSSLTNMSLISEKDKMSKERSLLAKLLLLL